MRDYRQLSWDDDVAEDCLQLVRLAVREDLERAVDWTTVALVPSDSSGTAGIVARQAGVVAGLPAARCALAEMDAAVNFIEHVSDGATVERGTRLATLTGPARSLLTAERLVLNLLGRLSGVATLTQKYVQAAASGGRARVYDTRKTTPGWRRLEKYAVRCGGGWNHRTGLFDAVLIKDNHLALGGEARGAAHFEPAEAVQRVRDFLTKLPLDDARREMPIEIEVDNLAQLAAVLVARPDVVLLDNMSPSELSEAVGLRDGSAVPVELEASGGVTLETIGQIAATGVERISVGALTHSAVGFDVALDWD